MRTVDEWKALLRAALRDAQRARATESIAVFRETLAAIDNAEAVDGGGTRVGGLAIEATPVGVGAADLPRRELTEDDVRAIVRAEIEDRLRAADGYAEVGREDRAETLRAEAGVLSDAVGATG